MTEATETTTTKTEESKPAENGVLSVDDRIARLQKRKDDKLRAATDERKANELEVLELEAEAETDGVRGIDFDIVDLAVFDGEGNYTGRMGPPILLVRSESSILHRKFTNGKITEVATILLVLVCVVVCLTYGLLASAYSHPSRSD